jgi:hypothetical protein
VNLSQALSIVNQPLDVRGYSNLHLAKAVNLATGPTNPHLSEVPMLDGSFPVRAVDVLLRLATATRPRYQVDVLDMQLHWSLLRYLGFFDSCARSTKMQVSAAGKRIPGNQRRVTSEEVGIGFAVLLAEEWMRHVGGAHGAIRTVDVDVALQDMSGAVIAGGQVKKVTKVGTRRPDYLLVGDAAGRSGVVRIAVLECKGTKTPGYFLQQLSSAAHQLQGLLIDGRRPAGLAVSTLLGKSPIAFYALESARGPRPTHDEEDLFDEGLTVPLGLAEDVPEFAAATELEVDLQEDDLDSGNREIDISQGTTELRDLAAAALQASWASIADMAGNDDAFRRWASIPMLRRLDRGQGAQRERVTRTLWNGAEIRGLRNVVTLPGGQLEVVLGVEAGVDAALDSNEAGEIIAAQQRLDEVRGENPRTRETGDQVASLNNDGSALVLTPL